MSYIGQQLPADVFAGFTIDKFTGTGVASQALTLTKAPLGETALLVTIDGVVQEPTDDFTVSGTTLTLVGTAANGSEINVTHLSGTVPSTLASKVDLNGVSDTLILDADGDTTISADTDDQIDFKAGGTDRLTVQSTSGNNVVVADGLTLTDGNITFSGSGHGIHLGVTSATDSNLLHDYEEGTWTAGWTASTSAPSGVNYSSRAGFYVKVGNYVFLNAYIGLTNWSSSGAGNARITGLPYAATSDTNFYASVNVGFSSGFGNAPVGGLLPTGANYMDLFKISSGDARSNMNSYLQLESPDMSGDEGIVVNVFYKTDS